jgi:hypothetical protein
MRRYQVTVNRPEVHFVDAESISEAEEVAIALVEARVRPAYALEPETSVERVAEAA